MRNFRLSYFFYIFLLFLSLSCSGNYSPPVGKVDDRFTVSKEKVIIDHQMNLEWLPDSGKNMRRRQAESYAKNLVYAGRSDWRLPTYEELKSLYDSSQGIVYKINPIFNLGGGFVYTSERGNVPRNIFEFGQLPFEGYWPHRFLLARLRVLVVRSI